MASKKHVTVALSLALCAFASTAQARDLTVATWNLGWHMDTALAKTWSQACGAKFALDPADKLWKPNPAGDKTGWQLQWGRNAPIEWDIGRLPPCDVYQENFKIVPVTEAAYAKRQQQIASVIAKGVTPDVMAFQEVSGRQAVLDVLPDGGKDFNVCSFEGYKVQRLAFAWRRSLGDPVEACKVYQPLSLPKREPKDQPRPGLEVGLRIDGKLVRLLTVHLKSSCVSPLEDPKPDGKGQLAGKEPNCAILQDQLEPLEAWLEQASRGADRVVMLGDFNRNLAHEATRPAHEPVRAQGDATDSYQQGVRSNSLWREVNDGVPPSSRMLLLEATCAGDPAATLCEAGKSRVLSKEEGAQLAASSALGCRNPIGLDHIAVSDGTTAKAEKVSLGKLGRTLSADATHPEPTLAVSDHCPLRAKVAF